MGGLFYLRLLPWLIFAVLTRKGGIGAEASAAAAFGSVLLISAGTRKFSRLEAVAGLTFALEFLALLIVDNRGPIYTYARPICMLFSAALLLAIMWRSAFTTPYTSDLVSESVAQSPAFRRANRAISSVWIANFTLIGLSFLVTSIVKVNVSVTASIFNWIVPIVLLVSTVAIVQKIWNSHIDATSFTTTISFESGVSNAYLNDFGGTGNAAADVLQLSGRKRSRG